jgi:hypothetical protein
VVLFPDFPDFPDFLDLSRYAAEDGFEGLVRRVVEPPVAGPAAEIFTGDINAGHIRQEEFSPT